METKIACELNKSDYGKYVILYSEGRNHLLRIKSVRNKMTYITVVSIDIMTGKEWDFSVLLRAGLILYDESNKALGLLEL